MDESPAVPEKENGRAAMSWRGMLAAWLVPLLLQTLILGVIACNDPCNGNPGCMAGTVTGLAIGLVNLPGVIVLGLVALVEKLSARFRFATALKLNLLLAVLPYLVGYLILESYR